MRIVRPLALLSVLVPAGLMAQGATNAPVAPAASPVITWPTLPLKYAAKPTHPEITAEDLMSRLYIYADDSMQGREAGQLGNFKATTYIAAEAKRMGLVPAGDGGTYFQTVPYKARTFDTASTVTVAGTTLKGGADFGVIGDATKFTAPLIYGGDLNDTARVDLDSNVVKGKVVLFTAKGGLNFRQARRGPRVKGAAAVIIAGWESFPPQFRGFFTGSRGFLDYHAPGAPASLDNIFVNSDAVARFFTTPVAQLTTGTMGSDVSVDARFTVAPMPYPSRNVIGIVRGSDPKLAGEYVAVGGHNDHIGIARRVVDHDSMRIFLRVVRPEGAEQNGKPATAAEQAEVDSILAAYRKGHPGTERLDSISNGADDDGSGTVSVLEIAERISSLKVKPKRSIIFVWHVGEEKGLLGSQYFTDFPTVPRDSIVAQLNIDMVGRGEATDETGRACKMDTEKNRCEAGVDFEATSTPLHGNPNYLQIIGSRRLSTELGDLIEKVNTQDKHGLSFDYSEDANGHPTNIYCRSDHYEYARYGIPIAFFTTGGHADYHQVTDEPQEIDYTHMARIDNLIEDIAVHVADLDHRPVVDHPKPDPFGGCQQ